MGPTDGALSEKMRIIDNGNVGIGTTSPSVPLHVHGFVSYNGSYDRYFSEASLAYGATGDSDNISIHTSNVIGCDKLVCFSDQRIKKNIVDVPDQLALQQVRDIPCRYYEYKDIIKKGTEKTIGFIAQEVKKVFPMAIKKITETIPDEYRVLENISWIPTSDNKWNLVSDLTNVNNIKYKFIITNGLSDNLIEKDITGNSDNTFTFDISYAHIFCYGKEVDDFHALDKDKIFALHHSAIQELDRQLQSEKQTIQSHDVMIQDIQESIQILANSNNTSIENVDDYRDQVNQADANTSSALDTIRLIRPKTYDDVINNYQNIYGFESQQVQSLLPHATKKASKKVANINQTASIINNKLIFSHFETDQLLKDEKNKLYSELIILDANNVPTKVTITNIVNNYIIEVNTNLQPFVRENTDNTEGSMGNLVFVYGQIVNDYLTVSKDDILSLNVAALQEIDKQLQEEKIKRVDELNQNNNITALEQKLEEQTTRSNQLEKQLEEQTNKMNVFEKQMQELYNKLNVEKTQRFELETKLETYVEIMNSMIINK
jgi:hypothetical protein